MKHLKICLSILLFSTLPSLHLQAQAQFTPPTQEELSMKSIPEMPGADAVVLTRDELDDDDNHVRNIYYRIKVLTEGGVKYGDVELEYDKRSDARGNKIGEIYARTIQPDGTIVPFTGKPYDKVIEKDKENAFTKRVFTLPAVKVGSILEYRYTIRWDDGYFFSPDWFIQTDLYLKKGHFLWRPTDKELHGYRRGGRESFSERLVWAKSLPPGVDVKTTRLPTGRVLLEVNVADIAPFTNEEYMPPIRSSQYHVFFYYSPYINGLDFWQTESKYWSSDAGKFENVSALVRQQAQTAIAGATTDEDKARKLYLLVMTLENTDYSRKRTSAEEKAEIKSAEDVLKREHGSSNQITKTYVALARAVGLQASDMVVPDRAYLIFDPAWQDFDNQLTDEIAIVHYGNGDHYLDPGTRFTPFGHLAWNHSYGNGVVQDNKDKVNLFTMSPGDNYKYSHTSRIGDLKLEADGHMTGTVTLTFEGDPALRWRHVALRNDENELKDQLRRNIEQMLPGDTEVKVKTVDNVTNGELPLKVIASVDGHIGTSAGSRVMLPSSLFEQNSRAAFPHEKREQGVYFQYSQLMQDAVRYTLPAGFTIESAPEKEVVTFQKSAAYSQTATQTPNSITVRRDLIVGEMYFPNSDYAELRKFYNEFERKDHNPIVLKRSTQTASATAGGEQ